MNSLRKYLLVVLALPLLFSCGTNGSEPVANEVEDGSVDSREDDNMDDESREKLEIENTISDRVLNEYDKASINKVYVNKNFGTDEEGDLIVLPHLKWARKNKAEMSRKMLEMYSNDLAATLAKYDNITEITIFWEVPYHLEGSNIAKMSYSRSGDSMMIGDVWYAPLIRE